MSSRPPAPVDILLLGTGWTATFLLPLLRSRNISYAHTSRDPAPDSGALPLVISPEGQAPRTAWHALPKASCVVIVFPLKTRAAAQSIVDGYELAHGVTRWIALGSTGAWSAEGHHRSSSPVDPTNARATAESALLALHRPEAGRFVVMLNLAGLYGGTRLTSNFAKRVGSTIEKLRDKGSLHLIHGNDVARAVVGVWEMRDSIRGATSVWGRRWIVSDGHVYDWWSLFLTLKPEPVPHAKEWVARLCREHGVEYLPRPLARQADQASPQYLERSLDGSEFWAAVGIQPEMGRCDELVQGMHRAFDPVIPNEDIEKLKELVDQAVQLHNATPTPNPFEAERDMFGMTRTRFVGLLEAWSRFLAPQRGPGESSKEGDEKDGEEELKIQPGARRVGADDDTWAAAQARLKGFSHYKTEIEGISIHYVRERPDYEAARAQGRKVIPLLLLHGWPGHFAEFLDVIKPLAHPGPSAPIEVPAFDVVVPSHTGYLFSSGPPMKDEKESKSLGNMSGPDGDLLVKDEARIMDGLMCQLQFPFYAGQAGDWSSHLLRQMAIDFASRVLAIHLNYCPAPPPRFSPPILRLVPSPILGLARRLTPLLILNTLKYAAELPRTVVPRRWWLLPAPRKLSLTGLAYNIARLTVGAPTLLTKEEQVRVERGIVWQERGQAYALMHGTRPATLALILESSPAALLAWIGEKLLHWTDEDPSDAEILTSLTLYWCTHTMSRSIYPYRNRSPLGLQAIIAQQAAEMNRIRCPTGYSDNPHELLPTPSAWVAQTANLRWSRKHEVGGHFFAMERPAAFVEDVRDCFSIIWPLASSAALTSKPKSG